jgi:hypothetical protein
MLVGIGVGGEWHIHGGVYVDGFYGESIIVVSGFKYLCFEVWVGYKWWFIWRWDS